MINPLMEFSSMVVNYSRLLGEYLSFRLSAVVRSGKFLIATPEKT